MKAKFAKYKVGKQKQNQVKITQKFLNNHNLFLTLSNTELAMIIS